MQQSRIAPCPPPPETIVSPEITSEATPETTPETTPEVTPEFTPEVSPEVTQEITPEVTPETTPEVTPEVTPEATPEVTPNPSPSPSAEPERSDEPLLAMLSLDEDDDKPPLRAASDATVKYYVAENGAWKEITPADNTPDGQAQFGNSTRYYVTVQKLENVYGAYGFDADDYSGDRLFPHTAENNTLIWADVAPVADENDGYRIPLAATTNKVHLVYYTPNNKDGFRSYFTLSRASNDAILIGENSFYTVDIVTNGLAANGETSGSVSPESPVFNGNDVTVTLPRLIDGANWVVTNGTTSIAPPTMTHNEDGTTTYNINSISSRYVFTAQLGDQPPVQDPITEPITIEYDAQVKLSGIGAQSYVPKLVGDDGKVNGQTNYSESYTGGTGSYTVRNVDLDVVNTEIDMSTKSAPIKYTFTGWRFADKNEIIKPGVALTEAELEQAKDTDGKVKLTAQWTPFIKNAKGQDMIATVNYYVGLDMEVYGNGYDYNYAGGEYFTNAVYTSRVTGTPDFDLGGVHEIIAHAGSSSDALQVNKTIRECVIREFNGIRFIDGMPTDEAVFNYIRNSNDAQDYLYIDKKNVTEEIKPLLTPDRYMIRWYVVKYNPSDGFHVDGVISERAGTLVIKKTFSGDSATIEKVKENYSITVEHFENENTTKTDYVLTLSDAAYDAASGTYTWVIQGSRDTTYYIKEENYDGSDAAPDAACEATYRILNKNGGGNTATTAYDPNNGISVVMLSYDDNTSIDKVQTVELHNSYTNPGVMTVVKEDELTGGLIGNVQFTLADGKGTAIQLFQKPNSPEYYTEREGEYTAEADCAKTDGNGRFYLKLKPGEYMLKEKIPGGYFGAETVKFTVSDENKITGVACTDITDDATVETAHVWAATDSNGTTLTVKNMSRKFSVTVKNRWLNANEGQKKPVTVSLMRNGVPLGGEYIKKQDADGSFTWNDLPLFVDGGIAEYSVKVSKIGDINSSVILGVTDGFADYSVTRNAAIYTLGEDGTGKKTAYWTDENDKSRVCIADHVLLGVNISPIDGALSIKKHSDSLDGEGLPGAEFGLFADEACTKKLNYELVSDEGGVISLKEIGVGTYYLKEITPPANYALDTSVYKVEVSGGQTKVSLYKDATGQLIPKNDDRYNYPVTDIVNETSLTLHVHNRTVEEGEALLLGATVKLEKIDGENPTTVGEFTLTDGTYKVTGLTRGTYRITQLSAQEGYNVYPDEYCFKIENGELVPMLELMTFAISERVPGWESGKMDDNTFLLTVYNDRDAKMPTDDSGDKPESSPKPSESPTPSASPSAAPTPTPEIIWWNNPYGQGRLPQTGQLNWPVPALAALGAAMIAAGCLTETARRTPAPSPRARHCRRTRRTR